GIIGTVWALWIAATTFCFTALAIVVAFGVALATAHCDTQLMTLAIALRLRSMRFIGFFHESRPPFRGLSLSALLSPPVGHLSWCPFLFTQGMSTEHPGSSLSR